MYERTVFSNHDLRFIHVPIHRGGLGTEKGSVTCQGHVARGKAKFRPCHCSQPLSSSSACQGHPKTVIRKKHTFVSHLHFPQAPASLKCHPPRWHTAFKQLISRDHSKKSSDNLFLDSFVFFKRNFKYFFGGGMCLFIYWFVYLFTEELGIEARTPAC